MEILCLLFTLASDSDCETLDVCDNHDVLCSSCSDVNFFFFFTRRVKIYRKYKRQLQSEQSKSAITDHFNFT